MTKLTCYSCNKEKQVRKYCCNNCKHNQISMATQLSMHRAEAYVKSFIKDFQTEMPPEVLISQLRDKWAVMDEKLKQGDKK